MNSRITIDSNFCHGKPVITNTRVLVSNILSELAAGSSYDEIIQNYPNISINDIKATLDFGSELARFETVEINSDGIFY